MLSRIPRYSGEHMDYRSEAKTLIEKAWDKTENIFNHSFGSKNICGPKTIRLNRKPLGSGKNYEEYMNNNTELAYIPSTSTMDNRLLIIYDCLNYVPMSIDSIKDHAETYVIDETHGEGIDLKNDIKGDAEANTIMETKSEKAEDIEKLFTATTYTTLNLSSERLFGIMNYWLNKANQLASFDVLSQPERFKAISQSRFILLGKPGVGKTALINYLFSIYAPSMKTKNVFWLRVNLGDPKETSLHLVDRLNSKFLRIFSRFYLFSDSLFNDPFPEDLIEVLVQKMSLFKIFRKLSEENRLNLASKFVDIMINLHDDRTKKLDSPVAWDEEGISIECARIFTQELISYIQQQYGYGFIIIFDGLDSVTIDYVRYELFRSWLSDITNVTNNERNPYKAVYIVTMRDYSYVSMYNKLVRGGRSDYRIFIECRVDPKALSHILKKRADYASHKLIENNFDLDANKIQNINLNLSRLLYELFYFNNLSEQSNDSIEQYVEKLLDIFNGNLRAVLRCYREMIILLSHVLGQNALGKLIMKPNKTDIHKIFLKKAWILYRLMLYGSCSQNMYFNRVSYSPIGAIEINQDNRSILPNIFNYRDTGDDKSICKPARALIKLMILQHLNNKEEKEDWITKVLMWISRTYGFDCKTLRYETREMIYTGIIEPNIDERDMIFAEATSVNYRIRITSLGEHVVNELIKKSIYFETICDNTPIQWDYSEPMVPLNRYEKDVSLGEYLTKKTRTMIFFILYLIKLEDNLSEIKLSNLSTNKIDTIEVDSILSSEIIRELKDDIASYVGGFMKGLVVKVGKSALSNFITDWYEHFQIPIEERC